jgi:demethylmenaquinone methyltransferase/2-methoxy-6-polyprenyl-1,4-benzoquinol methylase
MPPASLPGRCGDLSLSDEMGMNDTVIRRLEESNPLREPVLRSVIQALQLPAASRGLDVGCGIGLQAALLAEAVGPTGQVTALDFSGDLLAYARETLAGSRTAAPVALVQGDMYALPFDSGAFDWAWSADCVGYPAGEFLPAVAEMARVVRPGGSVAIMAWSSQQLLPGHALLEARLNATCSPFTHYLVGKPPEAHFARALGWFRRAGLEECTARTFVGDVKAPLGTDMRRALAGLFDMLWGQRQPETSPEDWQEVQRLCRPHSPDYILDLPDYCGFFTYTVYTGRVMARR